MGIKKHSLGSEFGKGKLRDLVDKVHPDDGKRFGDDLRVTHKGLWPKPQYKKPKHRLRQFDY